MAAASTRFGLSIRTADAHDAASLAERLAETGLRLSAADTADRIDRIRRGGGTILLAHEWGPPSGVIVMSHAPTLSERLPVARISFLFVAAEARRRGIGRLLVKAAAQSARSAGCGTLIAPGGAGDAGPVPVTGAEIGNALAAFWQANGFSEAGASWLRPLRKKAG